MHASLPTGHGMLLIFHAALIDQGARVDQIIFHIFSEKSHGL